MSRFIDERMKRVTAIADEKRKGMALPLPTGSNTPQVMLESLAALEHNKWCRWAGAAMENEPISDETRNRWHRFLVPYEELPEEIKEYSRNNARAVLDFMGNFFLGQK
jgi:hypothetical protein